MKIMMYRVAILLLLLNNYGQAQDAPPKTGGTVSCDLRIIEVSDGSVAASGSGEASSRTKM